MLQAKRGAFGNEREIPLGIDAHEASLQAVSMTLVVLVLLQPSPTASSPARELSQHSAKSFGTSVEAAVQSSLSEPNLSLALLVMQR
jgi:hypothetical protein